MKGLLDFFLILALFLTQISAGDFAVQPIVENDLKILDLADSEMISYVYYAPNTNQYTKIYFSFFPEKFGSDPGDMLLFFSTYEEMTEMKNESIEHCKISKVASCVYTIPENMTKIYFVIHCLSDNCRYKFRLHHFSAIHLKYEEKEHYIFDKEAQAFTFWAPKKDAFSKLVFVARLRYVPNEKELIYDDDAANITALEGEPKHFAVAGTQVFVFSSADQTLCEDCNITVIMVSQLQTIVEIEVIAYRGKTNIVNLDKDYIDYLIPNETNHYILSVDGNLVKEDDFNLVININSLTGPHKTLYAHGDHLPVQPEFSLWKTSNLNSFYKESTLVISKNDILLNKLKENIFYLAVSGDSHGLYSFHIAAQKNKVMPINLGIKQSGTIPNDKILYYKLQLWKNSDTLLGLTFSATITNGHIKIYGRKCGDSDDCEIITADDIKNNRKIDIQTTDEAINSFKFYPECDSLYCYYIFAVVGNSASSSQTRFELLLQKENHFINLIENQCYDTQINYGEMTKFKIKVENTTQETESVTFFVNTELDYVVSRYNKTCLNDIEVGCQTRVGNLYNPVIYDKTNEEKLNGDYLIFVFGLKHAEFIIFPEVKRKSQSQVYVRLSEGRSMKYFLSVAKPIAYFEFLVDLFELSKVEINIQSVEINALKIFVVKGDQDPSSDNYFISSGNNHLTFEHDAQAEAIYRVAVESKAFNQWSNRNSSIEFSITYSTENTIKHLETNQPYYDKISKLAKKTYLIYLDTQNEEIYITKHVIRPEDYQLEITFSLSRDENDEESKYHGNDPLDSFIKLTGALLKQICSAKSETLIGKCPLYISIRNINFDEVDYILNVRSKELSIELKEGKDHTTKFYEEENELHFHYRVTSNESPLNLYFYSLNFKFDAYIRIFNNSEANSANYFIYPSETFNNYSFYQKHKVSTVIRKVELLKCGTKCIISITIRPEKKKIPSLLKEEMFHIIISSGFVEIGDNKAIQFHSELGNLKLFRYSVRSLIDSDSSILIDLTNIAGFNDIYVSVNGDPPFEESYPTKDNFDYYTSDGHLLINVESLINKKNGEKDKVKDIYISAICMNILCESTLNVRASHQIINKILHGRPYDFSTSNKEVLIFEYYNYNDKSFELKVNKEKGQGFMQMVPCFDHKVEECALNNTKETSLNSFSSTTLKINRNDLEHFCFDCIYLIAITPNSTFLSGTFNVILDKEFLILPEGRKFYDDLDDNEENFYTCKAPIMQEIEIIVNVYHNEPELYVSRKMGYDRRKYELKAVKGNDPLISMTIAPDFDIDDPNVHDELYIILYAKTASNYSITCKSQYSYGILHPGLIEFGEIKADTSQIYLLNTNEMNAFEHKPKIFLGYLSEKLFGLLISIRFRPTKSDSWGNLTDANFKQVILEEKYLVFSYNSEVFTISNESGIYEIELTNKNPTSVKFSIGLQLGEINIMPYDTMMDVQIFPNEWVYYETYIPKKGLFTLDLVECVGTMELYTTNNHEKLINHRFDEEFKVFQGQTNLKTLKVSQGPLYIGMKLIENSTINAFKNSSLTAFGQLSSHFYEAYEEIPHYRLAVPEEGQMNYFFNFEEMKIFVNFKSIYCLIDCEDPLLHNVKVNYSLIAASKPGMLESHGKCGLISYHNYYFNRSEFKYDQIINHDLSIEAINLGLSFNAEPDIQEYYMSVVAKVQGYPGSYTPISMFYKDIEIRKPEVKTQKIILYGVTIVLIILVIILGICALYYYGGYKKIINKLRYEMKDVDQANAVTSLNASIEMKTTRYEGLMMDEKL